ncbi:acyl-CoA thioesterase [Lampropedia puyangensis]|uniref:Acyl-CoA thioesterase n=1 Tax=Lampropedia puyangensis TaxID=1330072 RepID=A0A4S8F577_9BURK|nr:acyl-CoA thioesterase [Lampropedia puyangensis]THU02583.1 acyl-CoA thioesterase [Lampropedia puyangensis]
MTTLSHEIELHAAFHDLDPMNIVWHGNYVKYLEIARCALLAKFDYDYPQMLESGWAWPIIDVHMKYIAPIEYGRPIRIRVTIVEWENRLKMDYLISDAQTGKRLHKASTIQVAVDINTKLMSWVCPSILWEKLGINTPAEQR